MFFKEAKKGFEPKSTTEIINEYISRINTIPDLLAAKHSLELNIKKINRMHYRNKRHRKNDRHMSNPQISLELE